MYPSIPIFQWSIPSYGVMALIGALASFGVLWFRKRRFTIPSEDVTHVFLFCVVGGIIGAKLLYLIIMMPYVIANFDVMNAHPNLWIDYFVNGFVFYGGLIGGFLFAFWYCRRYHIFFLEACDLFAPILPFFHIFGRIGCFLAGCCYGMPVSWGLVYAHGVDHVARLPLQLIEAGCNVFIFIIILVFERVYTPRGYHMPLYVILYSITRFILEFFRGDEERGVWFLSASQWISIAVVIGSIVWIAVNYKRLQKLKANYVKRFTIDL